MNAELKAPFRWFGGKRRVAERVWPHFGDCPNYVEPFFGSGAMLLARPHWRWPDGFAGRQHMETVNDLDGCVTNFWRAMKHDPEQTAAWADNPVQELDLHARHQWLHRRLLSTEGLTEAMIAKARERGILPFSAWQEESPDNYDCQVAGWWCWGLSSWIGDNWARPNPLAALPHLGTAGQGVNRKRPHLGTAGQGVNRKRPHLGNAGQGVNRKRPHLGNAGQGVNRQRPHLGNAGQGVNRQLPHLGTTGMGVNRQRPHLGDAGMGVNRQLPHLGTAGQGECARHRAAIIEWFKLLADRFRFVDIVCGDWQRVLTLSPTEKRAAPCAVFLDPPYSQDHGVDTLYGDYHQADTAEQVRAWCMERGGSKDLRIALCGYDTEHGELERAGWSVLAWKAGGGYANTGRHRAEAGEENCDRERIWFSPGCLAPDARQETLFGEPSDG